MFAYEKEGKLCIVFNDNKPVEHPDVIVEHDAENHKVIVYVGDTKIEGNDNQQ